MKSIGFRRSLVFIFDLVTIGIAFYGAFLLRFDFKIPPEQMENFFKGLPWIFVIQSSVFISQGLYRGLWSFASIRDLFLIMRGVILGVTFSYAILSLAFNRLIGWPRSAFLLDAVLLILILGGGRFAYRFMREAIWSTRNRKNKILIIGAGHSANMIAREFSSRPELSARIVGFVDDNLKLKGYNIHGAPVLGSLASLPALLEKHRPQEVIIAIPSLPGSRVKQILEHTGERGIPCRICPPIRDVLLGKIELNQLREVRVEDLLRREIVQVDDQGLQEFLSGKRILITGAGGSIGSELCRQVLKYSPAALILYDRSEYNLYRFEQELKRDLANPLKGKTQLSFVIGDILDVRRLNQIFQENSPQIVLHAAAYKHVPLMEENISESLKNNVFGTYQLVKMSASHQVEKFVLVSTDKAVRPTSIMGATKRMAELVTQAIGSQSGLSNSAVRFGNVLDSEGSVLPLFREQIARGGPVTITHKDITRYFMTIPEASSLVLQTSLLGGASEVFLLDMGEPVLIRELAEDLIRLSGLKPYEDIDIVFTGLRKGEKLYEELLIDEAHARRTSHPKIMMSAREHTIKLPLNWESTLLDFVKAEQVPDDGVLVSWIKQWVQEYTRDPAATLLSAKVSPGLDEVADEPVSLKHSKDPTYLH